MSKDPQAQAETKHTPGPIEQLLRDQEKEINRLRDVQKELLNALDRIQTLAAYMNSSGNGPLGTLARIGHLADAAITKAEKQP